MPKAVKKYTEKLITTSVQVTLTLDIPVSSTDEIENITSLLNEDNISTLVNDYGPEVIEQDSKLVHHEEDVHVEEQA